MSTILAVDTSSEACSIALLKEGQVYGAFIDAPRQHTQRLLPMIDKLLDEHQVSLSDLDAIAYGRGPGSFTGLRICLGIVQGLAYSVDVPVIAVSTLQTMAIGAIKQFGLRPEDRVIVALDARMSEVYAAVYECTAELPKEITPEFVGAPSDLESCPSLTGFPSSKLTKVGVGCHYESLQSILVAHEQQQLLPRAEDMLLIAEQAFKDGLAVDAAQTQPVYLRNSIAWKKRQRIRQ